MYIHEPSRYLCLLASSYWHRVLRKFTYSLCRCFLIPCISSSSTCHRLHHHPAPPPFLSCFPPPLLTCISQMCFRSPAVPPHSFTGTNVQHWLDSSIVHPTCPPLSSSCPVSRLPSLLPPRTRRGPGSPRSSSCRQTGRTCPTGSAASLGST